MEARKEAPAPEVFGTEEALARIVMEMLRPEGSKLLTVTDVTAREIFGLSTIRRYADIFKSKVIDDWVRDFLLLRISRFRMGRREFILLGTGMREIAEEKRKKVKLQDLYAGLR
jgi:hypothetical protein